MGELGNELSILERITLKAASQHPMKANLLTSTIAITLSLTLGHSVHAQPSLEQEAIALVLGNMDKAINYNNQLIEQKEYRRKWLLQNLLTGKIKLKGFINNRFHPVKPKLGSKTHLLN